MAQYKSKKRTILIIVLAVLTCLLLAEVAFVFFLGSGEEPKTQAQIEVDAAEGLKIKTKYCTLYYPAKWKDHLQVEDQGAVVKFLANVEGHETQPLFDIVFGGESGVLYDVVRADNGAEMEVLVVTYPFTPNADWSTETAEQISSMQEDINYLLSRLPLAVPEETTEPTQDVPEYEDMEIVTPYGTLYYPGNWREYLRVETPEGDVYTARFYATVDDQQEQPLFDLVIGPDIPGEYCVMTEEDGTAIALHVQYYPFQPDSSWTQKQSDMILAMQEAVNSMVEHLPLLEVSDNPQTQKDLLIETPYIQLYYPGALKEYLRHEVTGEETCTVSFYANIPGQAEQKLYDLILGKEAGTAYGVLTAQDGQQIGLDIRISSFNPDDSWTGQQLDILYAMQEAVNTLLEGIPLVPASEQEQQGQEQQPGKSEQEDQQGEEETSGDLLIETPYGQLKYPEKWKEQIRIEKTEGQPYTVKFYGCVAEGKEQLLFSICFGDGDGIVMGTVQDSEGNSVTVRMIPTEISAEDWTDAELNELYAMQEDINYLISALFPE